jgi:hypothetical protein
MKNPQHGKGQHRSRNDGRPPERLPGQSSPAVREPERSPREEAPDRDGVPVNERKQARSERYARRVDGDDSGSYAFRPRNLCDWDGEDDDHQWRRGRY